MSRFIDRSTTETCEIGPCECPEVNGTKPHETDTIRIRKRISYPDQLHLADAYAQGALEGMWALFNLRVAAWNFLDERGKPIPLSRAAWQNLDEATAKVISEQIEKVREEGVDDLPNT